MHQPISPGFSFQHSNGVDQVRQTTIGHHRKIHVSKNARRKLHAIIGTLIAICRPFDETLGRLCSGVADGPQRSGAAASAADRLAFEELFAIDEETGARRQVEQAADVDLRLVGTDQFVPAQEQLAEFVAWTNVAVPRSGTERRSA